MSVTCKDQELAKFISCPECGAQLDDNDIYRLTTHELYERYRISQHLAEEIECIICIENIPRRGFPKSPISPVCSHETQCCLNCLATHLTSQLESNSPKYFTCPECRGALPYASIQQYAKPETFTKYDKLLARNGLSEEPNFCWCTAGCGSGQLHLEGRENPLMICTNCRGKTCFTHQAPWHDGLTCREFDNLDATTTTNGSGKIEPSETRSIRNRFSNLLGRGKRNIIIGGITRLENDQEYRDRLLAGKLAKKEEDLERKRQKSTEEAEKRNRIRNQEAQKQEQAQEHRTREEEARKWREAEKSRAQEEKARKQKQLEEGRQRRRAEEAASESALLTVSKLCPNNCGARIQKPKGVVNAGMNSAGCALRIGVRLGITATPITNLIASIIHQSFEYNRVNILPSVVTRQGGDAATLSGSVPNKSTEISYASLIGVPIRISYEAPINAATLTRKASRQGSNSWTIYVKASISCNGWSCGVDRVRESLQHPTSIATTLLDGQCGQQPGVNNTHVSEFLYHLLSVVDTQLTDSLPRPGLLQ
ncbi:hypothetical protein CIB48_g7944 [Xylaria polymorpha]|nr:hypothetical protein CIB48_g7944 [Xylaria polymorpha]